MIPPISPDEAYVTPDGRLTARGLILFRQMAARLAALDVVAAVPAPTGGIVVDTDARAAIALIIAGAA